MSERLKGSPETEIHEIEDLSPAYDLVSNGVYHPDGAETLGLKFGGTKRFSAVSLSTFDRLAVRLGAGETHLADTAASVVRGVRERWPEAAESLKGIPWLREGIARSIEERSRSLTERA
ncbi:hypothetical protein [Nocardiopsis ansamitocini]|uniref:hypothetical protein n=1 Tax=Nocardiopsis ansamitocini TaxID=1670832 RepID=UPI002553783A|nr:hypothetical protein [Nocardiopsis ansamitocini]